MTEDQKAACPSIPPGRQPPVAAARAGFVGAIFRSVIAYLFLWVDRARQRRVLEDSSDHMLKDIGLSRADMDSEVRKEPWRD